LQDAAAFAVGVLNPDVVVLQIIFFGFDVAAHGIGDAAIGGEAERGNLLVDILQRLFEILGAGLRNKTATEQEKKQRAQPREP
jgi:hypothetical protein